MTLYNTSLVHVNIGAENPVICSAINASSIEEAGRKMANLCGYFDGMVAPGNSQGVTVKFKDHVNGRGESMLLIRGMDQGEEFWLAEVTIFFGSEEYDFE